MLCWVALFPWVPNTLHTKVHREEKCGEERVVARHFSKEAMFKLKTTITRGTQSRQGHTPHAFLSRLGTWIKSHPLCAGSPWPLWARCLQPLQGPISHSGRVPHPGTMPGPGASQLAGHFPK